MEPLQGEMVKVIESSTYRSLTDESIPRNSGVEKLCRINNDDSVGWILHNDQREETIVVSFETPMFINEIRIEESLNPGHITKIEMLETQRAENEKRFVSIDRWWTMWQRRNPPSGTTKPNDLFSPFLRRFHFTSKTIRITIDPRRTTSVGIRSISKTSKHSSDNAIISFRLGMIGSATFDSNFHRITIANAMNQLYDQTKDLTNTDVQFLVEGKLIGAHRNILSCRSQYFRTLLSGDFSDGINRQPIALTDIDGETLDEILFYIYTGNFHTELPYETLVKVMIYCNKIDFLSGKFAALESLCRHLSKDRTMLLSIYCLAKQMTPAFDHLLDYIYDLSTDHLNEICQQNQFSDLDKGLMIDLICQAAERRHRRDQQRQN